jgi:hypothetical protein
MTQATSLAPSSELRLATVELSRGLTGDKVFSGSGLRFRNGAADQNDKFPF